MSTEPVLKVAMFKALMEHAKSRYNLARAEVAARMAKGDRLMAISSDGRKLGAVSKSDPKPQAEITDATALNAWITEHYPERLIQDVEIIGSVEEIKTVLLRYAPALTKQVSKPDPDLVRDIMIKSEKVGVPIGPGGEAEVPGVKVETAEGTVSCRPTDDALPVVVDMLQTGVLDLFDVLPVGGE